MSTVSTHVLDAALGRPAVGLDLTLREEGGRLYAATTDADGRVRFDHDLVPGTHRIVFATGAYFAVADRETYFPEVTIAFAVEPAGPTAQGHHHVALLLSPFSYTTYRGS
jgi:5-hydroxyisourate hydrolase